MVVVVGGVGLLGLIGWLGSPALPERFDGKTIVVQPQGTDGLRVTEFVDLDTGTARRHGYYRELPVTFGVPIDVSASSPNAPDDLSVVERGDVVEIRVGDPDVTVRGRHRYMLGYTLPQASLADGTFALDVIGTLETFPTEALTVIVTGLQLDEPFCARGSTGATGGCDLVPTDIGYLVSTRLGPGEGLAVGGLVRAVTEAADISAPALPPTREYPSTWPRALVLMAFTAGGLFLARWWSQRRGRNEVAGTDATDAAFAGQGMTTRLVTDEALEELATVEFAPPEGLTPWEGSVLMSERLDDSATEAWWAHASAVGRVTLEEYDGTLVIVDVPDGPRLSGAEERALDAVFAGGRNRFEVTGFDEDFAVGWSRIAAFQRDRIDHAGWWTRKVGTTAQAAAMMCASMVTPFALGGLAAVGAAVAHDPSLDAVVTTSLATSSVLVGLLGALVGVMLWWHLRASRTATGSALALRTLSFRKFLAQSEGRHVEEAWKRGVLREYSAWAVALGEADAWKKAAGAAAVPVEAASAWVPAALVARHRSEFSSAHTKPAQSGSSGGQSFGSVGGGGGGGRSGSW